MEPNRLATLLTLALLAPTAPAAAQQGSASVSAHRTTGAITIDKLRQREPEVGAPGTERTVIRVLRDDRALYIGVRAYDTDPRAIRATQLRRDGSRQEELRWASGPPQSNDRVELSLLPVFISRMPKPLPPSFFRRPADIVAPELLGCTLTVTHRSSAAQAPTRLSVVITEVEAYLGTRDPASHVWKGRRTKSVLHLYSPPGTWYVYKSHGLHWCCNLTCLGTEEGHAVLLRGVRATDARTLGLFRRRRGSKVKERDLTNGPGKLTQALGVDLSLDGVLMAGSWAEVFAGEVPSPQSSVRITPRIGLTRAIDWPLRWVVK